MPAVQNSGSNQLMMQTHHRSWGRIHRSSHEEVRPTFLDQAATACREGARFCLAHGNGRSYGDVALNQDNRLILTRGLDRFLAFDRTTGVIECEAGVTLAEILRLVTSQNEQGRRWFLPVTPGTKYVTVGGAIANDVHGKNHHSAGCFGNHVLSLTLARSDGTIRTLGPDQEPALFRATMGGLGLTGLILTARLQLKAIPSLMMEVEDIRYERLEDVFDLAAASEPAWEYTVAWVDTLASGRQLGRGIFTRSRHAESTRRDHAFPIPAHPRLSLPFTWPNFALNPLSVTAFNAVYWRHTLKPSVLTRQFFDPVFYPLDAIGHWNRMYGQRGFYQYQCAIPTATACLAVRALLEETARSRGGSFLAVLKTLGSLSSPGLMSFPLPGATLALDLPNGGQATRDLLNRLDRITTEAGGRIFPAKDGRVSAQDFQAGYPRWQELEALRDPKFSSSLWRRVTATVGQRGLL